MEEWSEDDIVLLHWRLLQEIRHLADPATPLEEKLDTLRWVFTEREKDGLPFSFVNCLRVVGCSPLSPILYCGLVSTPRRFASASAMGLQALAARDAGPLPDWVREAVATHPEWVEARLTRNPQWINEQLKQMSAGRPVRVITPPRAPCLGPRRPIRSRPRRHAPIRSKELTMLTFKEALCLLAIVVAYGITGRMDYEDALLMEQVRPQVGADCIPAARRRRHPPGSGTHRAPAGGPPHRGGTRPEAPCVPDAASDQPMRLTRH